MTSIQKYLSIALSCMMISACTESGENTESEISQPQDEDSNKDDHTSGDNNPQKDPPKTDENPFDTPDPGHNPGETVDPKPETGTDPKPGTDPGTDPQPGTDPGTNPGTDPGTDPQPGDSQDKPKDGDPILRDVDGIQILPITYAPYTTLQRAFAPTIGTSIFDADHVKKLIAANEFTVDQTDKYKQYGIGVEEVEGEPWIVHEELNGVGAPPLKRTGKSLAWFWQISDPQITDQESPCRMEGVTIAPYVTASAYRAQAKYSTHMFDVHMQSAMRLSAMSSRSFDFALVTGDIADNAQKNEHGWFYRLMEGGVLVPDSGILDDPVEGPNNDFTDAYYTPGIGDIPWYPAIGNHDILYMGFAKVTDRIQQVCAGDSVEDLFDYIVLVASHAFRDGYKNGYQDASKPNSPVVTSGKTPADPDRRLLTKTETLQGFYDAAGFPEHHGLSKENVEKGIGYYSAYPIPGKPIRLISLDLNRDDWSEGDMTESQFTWLQAEIADAKSKKELVIVQSHQGSTAMGGSSVSASRLRQALISYHGVIMHITGHGHQNLLTLNRTVDGGYWELMLASIIEFPSQTRMFEIVHQGSGYINIYVTNLDANIPVGTMVEDGIIGAAARPYFNLSKDSRKQWEAEKNARNLLLRVHIPEDIAENLDKYTWSDVIESEALLKNLKFNAR